MALFTAKYRYDDPTLTAPAPGAALINDVGLVVSVPGIGPKTGGRHAGIPLAIGPVHTRIFRPHDRIEMTLPNTQLLLWNAPFETAAFRAGYQGSLAKREGWHWLNWTIAEHIAHDLEVETTERAGSADITPVVADGSPLVVVPCGAVKSAVASPAGEMYRSGYHRLGLKAARALTSPESIRILSALHGLLALDRMVEPYDLRMGSPGSITADALEAQAIDQGLFDHRNVVVLGGRSYTRIAQSVWPNCRTPLAGTRGIGDQQHRLARIAECGAQALT